MAEDSEEYVGTDYNQLTKAEKELFILKLEAEMRAAAKALDFEKAATLRDTVLELKAK